jgi:ketosteroid isomerase-like protein
MKKTRKGKPGADYHGCYVASWHRDADGQWRIARFLVQPFPQGGH